MSFLSRLMSPGAAAALVAAGGVALGAFGAHALKDTLVAAGKLQVWETAVLYHLVHAVAAFSVGHRPGLQKACLCWLGGIFLFSGSLYWLALGGPRLLGPVTPLGGVLFMAGWLLAAWDTFRSDAAGRPS
jgi:uncharacterized membrane protein YgdD (TMEM256/DUF423 family)